MSTETERRMSAGKHTPGVYTRAHLDEQRTCTDRRLEDEGYMAAARASLNRERSLVEELHAAKVATLERTNAALLSALEECLENTGGGWMSAAVIERARQALALARGEG